MAMVPKPLSISALSVELGRDRRTIAKALARIPPDGTTESGDAGWLVVTALNALDRNGDGRRGNGHGYMSDRDLDALEHAARRVDDLLDRLRAEPNRKKRRALLQTDGGAIGAFAEALEVVRTGHSGAQRMVEEPFCLKVLGDVVGEALGLCDWQLEGT